MNNLQNFEGNSPKVNVHPTPTASIMGTVLPTPMAPNEYWMMYLPLMVAALN
jgi:hypothetical protein